MREQMMGEGVGGSLTGVTREGLLTGHEIRGWDLHDESKLATWIFRKSVFPAEEKKAPKC